MKIIAHEYSVDGREQDNITGWNFLLIINRSPRQYQSHKKRKKSSEGLRVCDTHKPNTRISQQGLQDWRIRGETENRSINFAVIERIGGGLTCKRQQRRVFGRDAAYSEHLFGGDSGG